MATGEPRRPQRQDTYDLRDTMITDDNGHMPQQHADGTYMSDEEHSVLEDDSDGEERDGEYMDDDDGSSSLSIPNESIDFDLVYSLHSFAATVEGQANVVKGDSLFLMDDSNSYWWLVRVLKTQEVGYIPAENIETPFERLARLNKHRNVDLASATPAELQQGSRERLMANNAAVRIGATPSPTSRSQDGSRQSDRNNNRRSVVFGTSFNVHRYPPAVWHDDELTDEEDIEWDDESYEHEDVDYEEEDEIVQPNDLHQHQQQMQQQQGPESDDGMSWEPDLSEAMQQRQQAEVQAQQQQQGMRQPPQGVRFGQTPAQAHQLATGQAAPQIQMKTSQQELQQQQSLRSQASREQMQVDAAPISATSPTSPSSPRQFIDPAQVMETRKVTMTPSVAQDGSIRSHVSNGSIGSAYTGSLDSSQQGDSLMMPSAIVAAQQEGGKRTREEIEALEAEARKKANTGGSGPGRSPTGSSMEAKQPPPGGGSKLKKEPPADDDKSGKKKGGGILGGLFQRKSKKEKGGISSESEDIRRASDESGSTTHGPQDSVMSLSSSGSGNQSQQQQQQQQQSAMKGNRNSTNPRMAGAAAQQSQQQQQQGPNGRNMSVHASQLRQHDQQQQMLYQQYLNRSPSSPPNAQEPNYGLQPAAVVLNTGSPGGHTRDGSGGLGALAPGTVNASKPHGGRPGSLILSPASVDGSSVGVPELSVIRVFAGKNMQTEATFKTVLLNTSTTSADLIRQAMQRFRIGAGEEPGEYYLTAKQVEGGRSMILRADEHPLVVFEHLVEASLELPKVKRSSVGSISSVASNLSMHPAIKRLDMNDFSDDSAVKFYLNRKNEDGNLDDSFGDIGDDTLVSEGASGNEEGGSGQYLTVGGAMTQERFSSPSFRFALQVNVFPDDLPDDMVFDPHTEAIIFKYTLRERERERGHATSSSSVSSGVSTEFRRKVFILPKNVTVAEVIELALERFGILEGVVDGGDEVEDKLSKRKSSTRVRYGLSVRLDGQEKELWPSSKVIEAFPHTPSYRAPERRPGDTKRRSADASLLLGSVDDIQTSDPVFILRRSVSYKPTSKHNRLSAPLDELALSHLHRESSASTASEDAVIVVEEKKPLSKQELIAAQRAASRANQRAILGVNSQRGVDLLLPDKAVLRSSRIEVDDRMRYSYILPDGEAFDVTEIVQDEWRGEMSPQREQMEVDQHHQGSDLLESVYERNKDGSMNDRLDRVINKIKDGKSMKLTVGGGQTLAFSDSIGSDVPPSASSSSAYSTDQIDPPTPTNAAIDDVVRSRSPTPNGGLAGRVDTLRQESARPESPMSSGKSTPVADNRGQRVRSTTPTSRSPYMNGHGPAQPSIASLLSETSVYRTAPSTPANETPTMTISPRTISPRTDSALGSAAAGATAGAGEEKKRPVVLKDDFGMTNLIAIVQSHAVGKRAPPLPRLDPVDTVLFGHPLDSNSLHPDVREGLSEVYKNMAEMDKILDTILQKHLTGV